MDTNGTILDIIEKNPECKFPKIIQEYQLAFNIEEWKDAPFKESHMKFLEVKRLITESNGKYTITDSGKKSVKNQKDGTRNMSNKNHAKNIFKYVVMPAIAIIAIVITMF